MRLFACDHCGEILACCTETVTTAGEAPEMPKGTLAVTYAQSDAGFHNAKQILLCQKCGVELISWIKSNRWYGDELPEAAKC